MSADLVGIDVAVAHSGQEIVDLVEFEVRRQIVELDAVDVQSFEGFVHHLAAADNIFIALLAAEPLADLFAGMRGMHEAEVRVEPVTGRPA